MPVLFPPSKLLQPDSSTIGTPFELPSRCPSAMVSRKGTSTDLKRLNAPCMAGPALTCSVCVFCRLLNAPRFAPKLTESHELSKQYNRRSHPYPLEGDGNSRVVSLKT